MINLLKQSMEMELRQLEIVVALSEKRLATSDAPPNVFICHSRR